MSDMKYSIDLDKNIVFSYYSGLWSAADILKKIAIVTSDPKHQQGLNTLIDFSETVIPQGYLEADSIAEFLQNNLSLYKNIKIAFIVGEQSKKTVEVFESILNLSNLQILSKSFGYAKDAEEWLLK